MDVYVPFIKKHVIQRATNLQELKGLFAALSRDLKQPYELV